MTEGTITALIVDDERLAREHIRLLLGAHPQVRVLGEACNVAEAEQRIAEWKPHVVFLDIQMGGSTGFELLDRLTDPPRIVFVTAYDAFALRAFQVNAIDYLLKPIDPERLAEAVERVANGLPAPSATSSTLEEDDRALLRTGRRHLFLPVSDIAAIHADGNYTHVVAMNGSSHLVRDRFMDWRRRLPKDSFAMLDRSLLVRLSAVREWTADGRTAKLFVGEARDPLFLGRTAFSNLKKELQHCGKM
ncbi:MAG: response regulator [Lentisphaeria bacterium]|nr:response regulator [Lentisphaeria bacterium]